MNPNQQIHKTPMWQKLTNDEAAVLHVMFIWSDKNLKCSATESQIAEGARYSVRTVIRAIEKLCKKGGLRKRQYPNPAFIDGRNRILKRNFYDLSMWKKFFLTDRKNVVDVTSQNAGPEPPNTE